jgi:hypothetical protein
MPIQATVSSPGSWSGTFFAGSFLVGWFLVDAAREVVDRERVDALLARDVPRVLVAMGLR